MGASTRSDHAQRSPWDPPPMTRYAPVRLLGKGGMGAVHEVVDQSTGRRVALKRILAPDARQLLRFKREFRMMADLHHPNLVRLFDLGLEDDTWFFTMELVEGPGWLAAVGIDHEARSRAAPLDGSTLDSLPEDDEATPASGDPRATGDAPERSPRTPRFDALLRLVEQLLSALERLHAHGIVHRDLKPSNVLVDRDGRVKVADFGLALQHEHSEELAHGISRTGAALGTVAFMAPEQLLGEPVTASADLYALGCMLFQAITGRLPHTGPPTKVLHARLHEPPPRVEHYVEGVPEALREVCRALMRREPSERPGLAEVRQALGLAASPPDRAAVTPATSTSEPPFVGREPELSWLEEQLERTLAGELRFQLIEGESGIGKSALARQLVQRARARGVVCLRGRCYEREHLPFVAFDRAIDALTLMLASWPAARVEPIRPALRAGSRIFSALGMLAGDAAAGDSRDGSARAERVRAAFDGLWKVLEHCQRIAPVLIVLDDLQWCDDESVALLESLVGHGSGRICLLGLMRPADSAKHPLARRLRALARAHDPGSWMELTGLQSGDCAALVRLTGRDRLAPHILHGLASQTKGNPLLTLQLLDHLERLEADAREATLRSFRGSGRVIEALVEQFGAPARRLLQLAATAGGDVDEELLREASGEPPNRFRASLHELLAARMLERAGTEHPAQARSERLDVFHDHIRETVYDALPSALRRELHRALALALETRGGAQGRDVEALLRHWAAAGERAKCRALALEASARAESKLAFRRAAALLRVALEGSTDEEDPQLAEHWEHLGDLCEHTASLDEALDAYRRALERREATPHPERRVALLRLHGRIGETLMMAGRIREGRESFDRGLAMMGLRVHARRRPAVLPRLRATLWLVTVLPPRLVQRSPTAWIEAQIRFVTLATRIMAPLWPTLAAELALRGTIIGLRAGDRRLLQRLLARRVLGLVLQGRASPRALEQARRDLDASEALATTLDIPLGLELVMMHRALHAMATDTHRARRMIEDALAAMARQGMGDSYDGAIARAIRIMILFRRGEYDQALDAIHHETDHQPNLLNVPIVLFFRVLILCHRGQLEEAARSMDRLEACSRSIPPCGLVSRGHIARLTLMVAEGRFESALMEARACERAWLDADIAPKGDFEGLWLTVVLEAALGRLRTGELAAGDAAPLVAEARHRARRLATRGTLDHRCMGFRALALLSHHRGRPRAAERALDRALALSAANTSPQRRWLCLEAARDLGRMTLDKQSEAHALQTALGLVLPLGWARAGQAH